MDIDPGCLIFDQRKLRDEFNTIIENKTLFLFSHSLIDNYIPKYTEFNLDLNYFFFVSFF